jgi:hypothetical protein
MTGFFRGVFLFLGSMKSIGHDVILFMGPCIFPYKLDTVQIHLFSISRGFSEQQMIIMVQHSPYFHK